MIVSRDFGVLMRAVRKQVAAVSGLAKAIMPDVREIVEETATESRTRTPVRDGYLKGSTRTIHERWSSRVVVGGNGINYARRQHENLHYRHAVGEAKFLAKAVKFVMGEKTLRDVAKAALRREWPRFR